MGRGVRSLSEGKPGLFGAATSRAEAQALRLAAVYAVMDRSRTIEAEHLGAALAVWRYAEGSARYIFGGAATGDAVAERIIATLRGKPGGMSRTDLINLFGRNRRSAEIERALAMLEKRGRVYRKKENTGGRPAERWFVR